MGTGTVFILSQPYDICAAEDFRNTEFHRSGRYCKELVLMDAALPLSHSNDTSKFASLCKSFSKESFQRFPLEESYMPEVMRAAVSCTSNRQDYKKGLPGEGKENLV
ncbi:hypothetical protein NC652_025083 [Populus alba x Populus x berolinensis]|nr:hypothetical protein NC652_025083 [Populus alba x Populus x berolinensis]